MREGDCHADTLQVIVAAELARLIVERAGKEVPRGGSGRSWCLSARLLRSSQFLAAQARRFTVGSKRVGRRYDLLFRQAQFSARCLGLGDHLGHVVPKHHPGGGRGVFTVRQPCLQRLAVERFGLVEPVPGLEHLGHIIDRHQRVGVVVAEDPAAVEEFLARMRADHPGVVLEPLVAASS